MEAHMLSGLMAVAKSHAVSVVDVVFNPPSPHSFRTSSIGAECGRISAPICTIKNLAQRCRRSAAAIIWLSFTFSSSSASWSSSSATLPSCCCPFFMFSELKELRSNAKNRFKTCLTRHHWHISQRATHVPRTCCCVVIPRPPAVFSLKRSRFISKISAISSKSITVDNGSKCSVFTRTWLRYVRVFAIANPSVCRLSVTLVHPIQGIEAFGNTSSLLCTITIVWPPCKILQRSSQGNPSIGGVKRQMGSKMHRFWTCPRLYLMNGTR